VNGLMKTLLFRELCLRSIDYLKLFAFVIVLSLVMAVLSHFEGGRVVSSTFVILPILIINYSFNTTYRELKENASSLALTYPVTGKIIILAKALTHGIFLVGLISFAYTIFLVGGSAIENNGLIFSNLNGVALFYTGWSIVGISSGLAGGLWAYRVKSRFSGVIFMIIILGISLIVSIIAAEILIFFTGHFWFLGIYIFNWIMTLILLVISVLLLVWAARLFDNFSKT